MTTYLLFDLLRLQIAHDINDLGSNRFNAVNLVFASLSKFRRKFFKRAELLRTWETRTLVSETHPLECGVEEVVDLLAFVAEGIDDRLVAFFSLDCLEDSLFQVV